MPLQAILVKKRGQVGWSHVELAVTNNVTIAPQQVHSHGQWLVFKA